MSFFVKLNSLQLFYTLCRLHTFSEVTYDNQFPQHKQIGRKNFNKLQQNVHQQVSTAKFSQALM